MVLPAALITAPATAAGSLFSQAAAYSKSECADTGFWGAYWPLLSMKWARPMCNKWHGCDSDARGP